MAVQVRGERAMTNGFDPSTWVSKPLRFSGAEPFPEDARINDLERQLATATAAKEEAERDAQDRLVELQAALDEGECDNCGRLVARRHELRPDTEPVCNSCLIEYIKAVDAERDAAQTQLATEREQAAALAKELKEAISGCYFTTDGGLTYCQNPATFRDWPPYSEISDETWWCEEHRTENATADSSYNNAHDALAAYHAAHPATEPQR